MAVEPGSDPSSYHEADAVNEAVGALFESLPQGLQDWVMFGSAGRGRLVPPPADTWGSSCVSEEAVARCGDVADQHARGLGCRNTDSRDWVEVTRCSDDMEELIRDAWCLINDNLDVIEWILCMVFPGEDTTGFRERVQRRGLMRVRVKCLEGEACTGIAGRAVPGEVWGGRIDLCPSSAQVRVSGCDTADESLRTCIVVDMSATLVHELVHLVFDVGQDLAEGDGPCDPGVEVLLVENSFRWAMLRRYADAMASTCCADMFGGGTSDVVDRIFMLNTTQAAGASCEC